MIKNELLRTHSKMLKIEKQQLIDSRNCPYEKTGKNNAHNTSK